MIVTITLMANRKHRDCLRVINFKQRDIAGRAKGNDQFTQEWRIGRGLAASKWKLFWRDQGESNRVQLALLTFSRVLD